MKLSKNNLNASMQVSLDKETLISTSPILFIYIGCLTPIINDLNLTQLYFNTTVRQLEISAVSGDIEHEFDAALNSILALFTTSYSRAIPAFFNAFAATSLRTVVNAQLMEMMNLNDSCPEGSLSSSATFDSESTVLAFSIGAGVFVVIAVGIFVAFRMTHQQREKADGASEETELVPKKPPPEDPPALAIHPHIPWIFRYGVILLLVGNVALFISSNTSVGASVFLVIDVGSDKITLPSLFDFSLGNSVHDMWEAGVYPLSLLIAVFSGAWPYMKLLLMLVCWLVPTSILSVRRREHFLMALDALGKWSLIDTYVLTLMMVAFRFHIESPAAPETDTAAGSVVLNVFVEPNSGIYTFLIATMMSLALTHIILAFHRHTSAPAHHQLQPTEDTEALCTHTFDCGAATFKCTLLGQASVALLLFAASSLVVVGGIVYAFKFQFKGAAGLVLDYLHDSVEQSYSLLSLGTSLPSSAQHPDSVGVRFIQATFFTFAFAVPLVHLTSLVVLWLLPLNHKFQKRVFHATEVFNAWSALDVFVVAVIAALLEIEQFAQFIIGGKCDLINQYLQKYFESLLDGDPKCFDVIATLDKGCWILFAACLVYLFAGNVVMRLCHRVLSERECHYRHQIVNAKPSEMERSSSSDDEAEEQDTGCNSSIRRCCLSFSSIAFPGFVHMSYKA